MMQILLGLLAVSAPLCSSKIERDVEQRRSIDPQEFHKVDERKSVEFDEFHLSPRYQLNRRQTKNDHFRRTLKKIKAGNYVHSSNDEHNYLTTCIAPFRTFKPSEENFFREPFGDIKVIFDGGDGSFYNKTNGKYPGYKADMEFMFQYQLEGLRDHCQNCRIQINEGNSCDFPRIRFWNRSVPGAYNPWRLEYGAVYNSNKDGKAMGSFSLFNGIDFEDNKRRTVVVFDQDKNVRIGCGVLRRKDLGSCENGHNPAPVIPDLPTAVPPTSSPPMVTPMVTPVIPPFASPTMTPILSPAPPPTMTPIVSPIPSPTISPPVPPPSLAPIFTASPIPLSPPVSIPTQYPIGYPTNVPTPIPTCAPLQAPQEIPTAKMTRRPHYMPNLDPDILPPIYFPPAPISTPNVGGKGKGRSDERDKKGKGKGGEQDIKGTGKGKGDVSGNTNGEGNGGGGIDVSEIQKGKGGGVGDVVKKQKRARGR